MTLIESLKNPIVLLGQSVANPVNSSAKLPEDIEELTSMLKNTLHEFTNRDEAELRLFREKLRNI